MNKAEEILSLLGEEEDDKMEPVKPGEEDDDDLPKIPRSGGTSVDGEVRHKHIYEIDEDGNGVTVETIIDVEESEEDENEKYDHPHEIEEYVVSSAGQDRHNHQI